MVFHALLLEELSGLLLRVLRAQGLLEVLVLRVLFVQEVRERLVLRVLLVQELRVLLVQELRAPQLRYRLELLLAPREPQLWVVAARPVAKQTAASEMEAVLRQRQRHGKSARACTFIFLGQATPLLRLKMFATPVVPYLFSLGAAPLS